MNFSVFQILEKSKNGNFVELGKQIVILFSKFNIFILVPFSISKQAMSDKSEEVETELTKKQKSSNIQDNSLKKINNSNNDKKKSSNLNSKNTKIFFLNFLKLNKKLKISEVGKSKITVNNIILKSINKIMNFLFKDVKVKLNFILQQTLKSLIKHFNTKQISYLSKQAKQLYD